MAGMIRGRMECIMIHADLSPVMFSSLTDSLCPEDSGARYQAPSETPDLASDFEKSPGLPLNAPSLPNCSSFACMVA